MKKEKDKWVVATDASVDALCGLSVFAYIGDGGVKRAEVVYGLCSMSAELAAIAAALTAAPVGVRIKIITDCKGAVQVINRYLQCGKARWDTGVVSSNIKYYWELIKAALMGRSVEIVWVKAHAKDRRNKEVDRLARRTLRIRRMIDSGEMEPWFQPCLV